ncbi:cytochrome-c oxidase, cbb3-type subunit III [Sphingomonas sp. KRR8]|uniref:cytochrome-c oxidase, cbb3-type subunit III n=1 Tax=Sphingomonas sp. KRR8 TaxID=2942996 RepID=UPI0020200AC2|nr:cytochrome-c oxidase, cbb3-type subunit III [Sphingomonas sp. KRR8]URD60559.1 cytochrome-c oxidase, cbb3-type subunit III [Sphingomonas sp. KRR8]
MADNKSIDQATGTETVGHEWDGIQELNTPLPRWWLWTFYASIVWAIAYTVAFPAWPLVSRATAGVLHWSSRGQLDQELAADAARKAPLLKAIAATPIEQLPGKPQLWQAAVEGGHAAFRNNCTQCHGTGAAGSKGYPNLNDDDWLWGGDLKAIQYTIANGVRNPDHPQTRTSQMPSFGRDGLLQPNEISDVVAYVRTISHQQPANAEARRGAAIFAANCAACHGATGTGNRAVGAPNLTDSIWLYGGDEASLTNTVTNAHYGVMPRWEAKLGPTQVKMLAAYVYSLGGGERAPVQIAGAPPKR